MTRWREVGSGLANLSHGYGALGIRRPSPPFRTPCHLRCGGMKAGGAVMRGRDVMDG